jgi:opacity protein-like surface antigen
MPGVDLTRTQRRILTLPFVLAAVAWSAPVAEAQLPPVMAREGWYLGISEGYAYHDGTHGDLRGSLAGAGFNNPSFNDDSEGTSFKAFLGYRFAGAPLSLEAGYIDFSRIEGNYTVPPPPGGVGGTYDEETYGWQLVTRAHLYDTDNLSVAMRLGGWWRETDVDVVAQPGSVTLGYTDRDFDVTAGLDVTWQLTDLVGLRGEYERFFMDGKDVDVLSLGLLLDFR